MRSAALTVIDNNEAFHRLLTEGVDVKFGIGDGKTRTDKVWLVDFANPENNEFLAVNQFTVIENNNNKRPDIVLFINGLPLVVIELKNAADENADVGAAFRQLQTYQQLIPSLFTYNAFLVISDGWFAKVGHDLQRLSALHGMEDRRWRNDCRFKDPARTGADDQGLAQQKDRAGCHPSFHCV